MDIEYNSRFLYRYAGVITRFMNRRNIPHFERPEFLEVLKFQHQLIKIIEKDVNLRDEEKIRIIVDSIRYDKPPCVATLGNQRSGKDVTTCFLIDKLIRTPEIEFYLRKGYSIEQIRKAKLLPYRICTYLSFADYPWLEPKDKYFSLEKVPKGTPQKPVILYVPELDMSFSARSSIKGDENDILNTQLNTLAQNNIMILGTAKVAANVDIAFWRHCSIQLFKFIDKQKLIYGERKGFLSEETMFMLPRNRYDKTETLFVYGDQILSFHNTKPEWFSEEQSNQYGNITEEQKNDYRQMLIDKGLKPEKVEIEMRRLFSLTDSE